MSQLYWDCFWRYWHFNIIFVPSLVRSFDTFEFKQYLENWKTDQESKKINNSQRRGKSKFNVTSK